MPNGSPATPANALELWKCISAPLRFLIDQEEDLKEKQREALHEWIFDQSPYRDDIAAAFYSAIGHTVMLVCLSFNEQTNLESIFRGLEDYERDSVDIIAMILQILDNKIQSDDLQDEYGDIITMSPPRWEAFFTREIVLIGTILFDTSIRQAER